MTNLIKRTATLAMLATILTGTIMSAQVQAARVVPPPPPGNDQNTVIHDRGGCLTPNQGAARINSALKDAGYLDTFRHTAFPDGKRYQAFGVKSGNKWYAIIYEICKGRIITEGLQKQKPPFL